MNSTAMLTIIVAALALFSWSAFRRWNLLCVGAPAGRTDRLSERLAGTWRYAFRQEKMDYYSPAGLAHKLIFTGFLVLLLRSIILWGRAFSPSFSLWIMGSTHPLGEAYDFIKDIFAILVLIGTSVFFYYRVINPQKRMTLHFEGVLILLIIATMMVADMLYDGAAIALVRERSGLCGAHPLVSAEICARITTIVAPFPPSVEPGYSVFPSPGGSLFAEALQSLGLAAGTLTVLAHVGYWTHVTLVLVFLNILPHSKHFHIITAIPNVFMRDLTPPGRLQPMAPDAEKLMEIVGAAGELPDPTAAPVGIGRVEHLTWKAILDTFTCTECGRCSDNCPAHRTGKVLSPKQLTLDLRDHLYAHDRELVQAKAARVAAAAVTHNGVAGNAVAATEPKETFKAVAVTDVIHPDVLWACTTCRACEEQCPVMISYVDKIVDMRRNLVLVKGEFPAELQRPFQGMEVNGNPWNLSRLDRAAWAEGLDIPTMAEKPTAQVLFWVGCAGSYDDRAKKIARATAKLLKAAGVDFAILGPEESCTGDPARRAGNEFLFAVLARATLRRSTVQGAGGYSAGRHDLPPLLQHAEERVPRLRHPARGRPPHRLPPRPARREEAPARAPVAGQGHVPRQLLPRALQRHLRVAARDPPANPRRRAGRARLLDEAARPLLRRWRRPDVHGGAEHRPRERQAHPAAPRHARHDHRQCLSLLHDHAHRRAQEPEPRGLGYAGRHRRAAPRGVRGALAGGWSAIHQSRPACSRRCVSRAVFDLTVLRSACMNHCPTCQRPVLPRPKNPSAPFCSERCRQVDLGKWLNEEHRIPVEGHDVSSTDGEGEGLS